MAKAQKTRVGRQKFHALPVLVLKVTQPQSQEMGKSIRDPILQNRLVGAFKIALKYFRQSRFT